jgi:hypothetical protein
MDKTEIKTAQDARAAGLTVFKFFSDAAVKAVRGEDGSKRVMLTASSNADDLVGDVMSQKGLTKMKTAAPGTTMFLNHKSQVPEDVFGAVEATDLIKRKAQLVGGGEGDVLCLDYVVIVEETNDRAVKTFDMIEAGRVRLGASVTVAVLEKSANPNNRRGIVIDDLIYIECSIVGIPCNQQSFVQYARKALGGTVEDAGEENASAPVSLDDEGLTEMLNKSTTAATAGDEASTSLTSPATAAISKKTAEGAVTTPTDAVTDEEPVTAADVSEEKIKGMFADAMANQKPRPYELFDVLCTVLYRLARLRDANMQASVEDSFDYVAAATLAVEECCKVLIPSFIYHFGLGEMAMEAKALRSLPMLKTLSALWADLLEKSNMPDDESKALAQSMHDLSAQILSGAPCAETVKTKSGAELTASPDLMETVNKQLADLETDKKGLDAQLAEKTGEVEVLQAIADTAVGMLEKNLQQPLSVASAS